MRAPQLANCLKVEGYRVIHLSKIDSPAVPSPFLHPYKRFRLAYLAGSRSLPARAG